LLAYSLEARYIVRSRLILTVVPSVSRTGSVSPTVVYDTYWRFAAERLAIFYRRLKQAAGPWTADPILRTYRFTNAYRATDRVSQYLISEIQYHPDRSQDPREVFFRTLLFKIFNKIETWEILESAHGPLSWATLSLDAIDKTLSRLSERGLAIYSAAYIMPAPAFGQQRKHSNHLKLIAQMMEDRLPDRLQQAPDLQGVYERILNYPGLGRFLAFQYTIDLNYSSLLDFSEEDFVIAGPGALDGISKCFSSTGGRSPEAVIRWVTEQQANAFTSRGLDFAGLYGRPLQPIDCQNLFCEISKYARVAHPEVVGVANRRRIKQSYKPTDRTLPALTFPYRWGLKLPVQEAQRPGPQVGRQAGGLI
jgi:hypothetical protein